MTRENERQPLLNNRNEDPAQSSIRTWWKAIRQSPVTLLVPLAFTSRPATQLPQTTEIFIIQQLICRLWYNANDPDKIPADGDMGELCQAAPVQEWSAFALTLVTALEGLGSLIGYQVVSYYASRYGRRPAMLGVVTLSMSSHVFLITSHYMNGIVEIVWLVMWQICESLSGVILMIFLINLYIVDTVEADSRSPMLSQMNGWFNLSDAISFLVGGRITTRTHRALPVYYVGASLNFAALLYIAFILPESFTKEKQDALQRERSVESIRRSAGTAQLSRKKRIANWFTSHLGAFKTLSPLRNGSAGKRNWRLVICAVHILIVSISAGYSPLAMLIFLTTKFPYTPADTGFAMAMYALSSSFVCTFVLPVVFKVLRPIYRRIAADGVQTPADSEEESPANDRLDLHIVVASWLVDAIGFLCVVHATSIPGQLASIILIGSSAGRSPVFRSLVASSVEPLKQGETLAAIEMIGSVGYLLAPLVLGTILTSTIVSFPTLTFWINALLILVGCSVLLLVKTSDRYQKPREERRED